MAKIVDPDQLHQGIEVNILPGTKKLQLCVAGNLNDTSPGQTSGVTLQAVYSFGKEEWKTDTNTGLITIDVVATAKTFTRSSGSYIDDGFAIGQSIETSGFTNPGNNTRKTITNVTALVITVDTDTGLVDESGDGNERIVSALNRFRFPIKAIYEAKFLMQNGWDWSDQQTRDLIRDAGWKEITDDEYATLISLGLMVDDQVDQAYHQEIAGYGETPINFDKTGRLNEPIKIYSTGADRRNYRKAFLRMQGKIFDQYNLLVAQGFTALTYIAYRLPLSNATDIKILYEDGDIAKKDTGAIQIDVVASAKTFTRLSGSFVDDGFEVGNTIQSSGFTNPGNNTEKIIDTVTALVITVTSSAGLVDETGSGDEKITNKQPFYSMLIQHYKGTRFEEWAIGQDYALKDVVMNASNRWFRCILAHTGAADKEPPNGTYWEVYPGEKQIGANYYAFNREIRGNVSYKPDSPEIYAFAQYKLRQTTNINDDPDTEGYGTVKGKLANPLCFFVGDTLKSSPGVWFANFDPNITNAIVLQSINPAVAGANGLDAEDIPKAWTERTFPFVSAGTMVFNTDLVNDPVSKYWMYFVNAGGKLFDSADAIIVNNNAGTPITGSISGQENITFDFDYDGNNQGGRTPGTDASVIIVAMGLSGAEWVEGAFTITKAVGLTFPVNAPTERNYYNP